MDCTNIEKAVLRSIKHRTEKFGIARIDGIVKDVYVNRAMPKNPRKTVAAIIRTLTLKLEVNKDGQISRESNVGAGNLGEYVFIKYRW